MTSDLIDFGFYVGKPRKEYVGLKRFPFPIDSQEFKEQLDEACLIAIERIREMYDRHPKRLQITVQRDAARLDTLTIQVNGDQGEEQFQILSEAPSQGSELYEFYLQRRLIETGRIVQYYEKLDQPPEEAENIDDILFGNDIKGMTEVNVMIEAAAHRVKLPVPEKSMLELYQERRLRKAI